MALFSTWLPKIEVTDVQCLVRAGSKGRTSLLYKGFKSYVREKGDWCYHHVYMQSCSRGQRG